MLIKLMHYEAKIKLQGSKGYFLYKERQTFLS